MTIGSATNRNSYTGNGSNTVFAYTFKIFDEADIDVFVDDVLQTITTDYTVSGVGNEGGGNITFTTAPASATTVVFLRDEPFTQQIDFIAGDDLPETSLEEGLDRGVIRDQQLSESVGRAVKLVSSSSITDPTLVDLVGLAGQVIKVNAGETGLDTTSLVDSTVVGNYTKDTFDGTGSQTDFTLSSTVITQNALLVHVDNTYQFPGTDFTATGTTISFTSAPASGTDNIEVINLVQSAATTVPADGSVTSVKLANNSVTESKVSDTLVNELAAVTSLQDADQFWLADNSNSDNNRKITYANLYASVLGSIQATGTWTPALTSSGATFSYSSQLGEYIKIGNLVLLEYYIALNANPTGTTTNTTFLTGSPYSTKTSSGLFFGGAVGHFISVNLDAGTQAGLAWQASSGSSSFELKEVGDNAAENSVIASQFSNASQLRGTIMFISA